VPAPDRRDGVTLRHESGTLIIWQHGEVVTSLQDGYYSYSYGPMHYSGCFRGGRRDGHWQVFHKNGSMAWEISWTDGVWDGPSNSWWEDGTKLEEGRYNAGRMTGTWTWWYRNGQMAARGPYEDDLKVGQWLYFDEQGRSITAAQFAKDDGDWARDDYTGLPRGENWPMPPDGLTPDRSR